jgi:opacity protein-like surface antigen
MNRLLLIVLLLAPTVLADPYVRFGGGVERTGTTMLRDADCESAQPPALFGCDSGIDGRPLAARGDAGDTPVFELAAGMTLGSKGRIELAIADRSGVDFDGGANFRGVTGVQPVRADGRSRSAMVVGAFNVAYLDGIRPFVFAGAGLARNETSPVTFSFPSIGPEAVTVIRGGRHDDFAWTAGAGFALPVNDRITLELTLRYSDLGELRTEAGQATIVRPTRSLTLDIAGTHASLRTLGTALSLRCRL